MKRDEGRRDREEKGRVADRSAVGAGAQLHFYCGLLCLVDPTDRTVHKRVEFLDPIEDSLQLHPVFLFLSDAVFANTSSQIGGRMLYSSWLLVTVVINPVLLCFYPQIFLKTLYYR